jgi:uncharacterized protein YeaO (DUF488 family)
VSRAVRTFRIGSPRQRGEGLRIGTVRLLPRGVRKEDYARGGYFDVWFPLLAPSRDLMRRFLASRRDETSWKRFAASYRREMTATDPRQAIRLLALLGARTPFAIGCYCEDESHCHRSILRELIERES